MLRIAIVFDVFSPYIHARLNAVGNRCDVIGIEFSTFDRVYAWDRMEEAKYFRRVTLFQDKYVDEQPTAAIIHKITSELDKSQPHVVAIPGWANRGGLVALSWCLMTGTPAVVMSESTMHDSSRNWWKEAIKQRIIRLCSAGLVGGMQHVDYIVKLGIPRERIFTGYDVVDNSHFASGADATRRDIHAGRVRLGLPGRYFLASSRFIEKKNLSRLLQAYADYRQHAGADAWKLVLLGGGPLKLSLLKLSEELNLFDQVILPGFKQYGELPAYYGLAGAFVHASTVEQWGLVVNEAMAAGLPVIVSERCGCAPDLVENGRNGFTFDPYDVAALAGLMRKVAMMDECDRAAMGRASREIISRWSPETFAENLLKAVEVVLSMPRPKAELFDKALLWGLIHR